MKVSAVSPMLTEFQWFMILQMSITSIREPLIPLKNCYIVSSGPRWDVLQDATCREACWDVLYNFSWVYMMEAPLLVGHRTSRVRSCMDVLIHMFLVLHYGGFRDHPSWSDTGCQEYGALLGRPISKLFLGVHDGGLREHRSTIYPSSLAKEARSMSTRFMQC